LGVELGGPPVVIDEHVEAGAGLGGEGDHVVEGGAVLAAQLVQQLATGADGGQPLGVVVDALAADAHVGGDVGQLRGHGAEAVGRAGEGATVGQRRQGGGDVVAGRTVAGERGHRGGGRLLVRHRVGEDVLLGVEALVLVGSVDAGRVELGDLEPQKVDLARPGSVVAPQFGEGRVDGGDRGARLGERFEVDASEAIDRAALGGRAEQRLVGVLAVQVDEIGAQLRQRRCRRQAAVDVGPAAPDAGHDPSQHHLAVAGDEPALDHGLVGPVAHDARIGAPADEQLDGLDQHGLAGAGLPGEGGHAGPEDERHVVDDAEVTDAQLGQHDVTAGAPRGHGWPPA
jgi:hypothetical protein